MRSANQIKISSSIPPSLLFLSSSTLSIDSTSQYCDCPTFCRDQLVVFNCWTLRYRDAETRHRKEGSIRAGRVLCSVTRAVSEEPYIS